MSEPSIARTWLAPEAVQSSPMDCGPTALYALLAGCGVRVSYARLREACQTNVDGTSINALERVANELGLEATQILAPLDHVAHPLAATLPAIAVTRLSNGSTHFVLLWRRIGPWVQIMDPASGRRWVHAQRLAQSLYIHGVDLPADVWRRFAGTRSAARILERELARFGHKTARERVAEALADPGWRTLAALEATSRMVRSLVRTRAIPRGRAAHDLAEALFQRARDATPSDPVSVPAVFWTVRPQSTSQDGGTMLRVHGALLVRVLAKRDVAHRRSATSGARPSTHEDPVLEAALCEPRVRVARELFRRLSSLDRRAAIAASGIAFVAAIAVLAQALAFRAFFELLAQLGAAEQRLGAALAVVWLLVAILLLDVPLTAGLLRLGRALEARVRIAFQERLPRLSERWFGSRPASDMAERAHSLCTLNQAPTLAGRLVRALATLTCTTLGMCWLDPGSTPLVLVAAAAALFVPLTFASTLTERELLVRSHHGALSRFYLEGLLGLVAVRVHGAHKALLREHESLLVEWVRAGFRLARGAIFLRAVTSTLGTLIAIGLVVEHIVRNGTTPATLLFGFWAVSLPAWGEQLALIVQQTPLLRNVLVRALEPLGASVDREPERAPRPVIAHEPAVLNIQVSPALKAAGALGAIPTITPTREPPPTLDGVSIDCVDVGLLLGGHTVLEHVTLKIAAGEHVALIGRSGAGKSTLLAMILGLHKPSHGSLLVDGDELEGAALDRVRRATAWVDPAVQLWNKSLFANLVYGAGSTDATELARALAESELEGALESLPDGLATRIGEGGGFLSGGEGERVRLARAALRPGVRLALLDEPFRGLDRDTRHRCLTRVRERWRDATLVCVTHDVAETQRFDRVIVVEHGRIIEDGKPSVLAANAASRYARLMAAERDLIDRLWGASGWTRWRVDRGVVEITRAGGRSA